MAIISFAQTVDEYLSGQKYETRRDWKHNYHKQWVKWWKEYPHFLHQAYNKSPRAGGKPIGKFVLICAPFYQQLKNMTLLDLSAEGGMCKTVEEFCKFIGKKPEDWVTVIRFEKL